MAQVINPANAAPKKSVERARIPMSVPMQKLQVPEIQGYHLHWMLDQGGRIQQAIRAGYEFVEQEEVELNNFGLADDASKSGNTDLGSRVSISAGADLGQDGTEQRLYLMKIRQEWWEEDQRQLEARNEQIAASLRGGTPDAGSNDPSHRYIPDAHRKGVSNLFTPKHRRS